MLQNKFSFNQSSVSLEIIGLPDYSNNENKDQISIISQWKLKIIDKPLIEGNIDHLSSIMEAFYNYSNFLVKDYLPFYESSLIDIKALNFFTHKIVLKSSKPDVKPLNLNIGNSVLTDIINCFDQFNSSNKVRKINIKVSNNIHKNSFLNYFSKQKIVNLLLPPTISIFSLFFISSAFIFIYNFNEKNENKVLVNPEIKLRSTKITKTIL